MNQQQRVEIANNTLEILEKGSLYQPIRHQSGCKRTHNNMQWPTQNCSGRKNWKTLAENIPEPRFATSFEVINETTLDAARRLVVVKVKQIR